jgi:predicted RNA binding protein YcfA (HicA-like mRNA interferase family)
MNQRLPAVTAREAIRALERAGFVASRQSGSHVRLIHATDPARKVTVPVHGGDVKRGTLRESSRRRV